jgi:SAM-dependent MidA family methyltransferase
VSPLAARLRERIAAEGPMTVADWMAECLLHPVHGYYATRDPLGSAGDFTTAPEVSQVFGEIVGLALAQAWIERGRPSPVRLVELGPGRGTLMADALRAVRATGLADAATVHLVEASPALRAVQARTLSHPALVWHDRLEDVPEGPLLLLANEFLDALPVRQFVRAEGGWRERMVTLGGGGLAFGLSPPLPADLLGHRLDDVDAGGLVELRPALGPLMAEVERRVLASGGAALLIDYGGWRSLGDTLQAVRGHAPVDLLDEPGEADLTAHVDFEAVARAAAGLAASAPTPQGAFLERLGAVERARRLARGLEGAALEEAVAAHRRLTHPDEMGTLFKAMGLWEPGGPPLPGLDLLGARVDA